MFQKFLIDTYKKARRVVMIVFGFTILIIGIVMVVLPGPGAPIVFLALTILAAEFVWARRLLKRLKETVDQLQETIERIPLTQKIRQGLSQTWLKIRQLFVTRIEHS